MALEGNLSSFGLEEILQLIAVQQKTGMLSVAAKDKSSVVCFRDGLIVSTRDRRRQPRDPFKDYLTRYGILSREELIRITQMTSQSKLDLIDVLSSEAFLDEKALHHHWRNHILETLHDIVSWDQCSYKFVSGDDVIAGVKTLGEFAVEALLMESMRRLDEFPLLIQAFPAEGVRVAATGRQPAETDEFSDNERNILALLRSPLTVAQLVARGKMPVFDVYEALKLLRDKGLIAVEEHTSTDQLSRTGIRPAVRRRRGNPLPLLAASFLCTACAFLGAGRQSERGVAPVASVALVPRETERARVEHHLRWLLEAYRAEYGVYPESLRALLGTGLVGETTLARAAHMDLRYTLTAGGTAYTLL